MSKESCVTGKCTSRVPCAPKAFPKTKMVVSGDAARLALKMSRPSGIGTARGLYTGCRVAMS